MNLSGATWDRHCSINPPRYTQPAVRCVRTHQELCKSGPFAIIRRLQVGMRGLIKICQHLFFGECFAATLAHASQRSQLWANYRHADSARVARRFGSHGGGWRAARISTLCLFGGYFRYLEAAQHVSGIHVWLT